ncbi:hypothetical protein AC482_04530 [miscellaneous Crenarchaeota group-15 archaeon DG-45]|uniref:Peptidase M24 domain-containing protein n=1 Tax=miscellaneous Crenarchaeota group-15 archaeon DG-45 TaxID=1685127 RepID=A0A0M0BNJ4_9ARCH|nr:MAG: hypothetical protein AC482_04530 [miscellaneous Crenarchaeota group-15 archaeon DG-45]
MNMERAYETMQSRGVDAIIASSLENVYYVSDYWSLGRQLRCGTNVFAILPLEGEPAIVAPLNEVDLIVDSGSWIGDVRFYGAFDVDVEEAGEASEQTLRLIDLYRDSKPEADAVSALLGALEARGLSHKVLAVDASGLSSEPMTALPKKLPDAKVVDGLELLREIRLVKTEEEVRRIRRATEISEKSMEDALEIARSEIMEVELAGIFEYSVASDGGRVTYNLIGFGERSAFPHPIPSDSEARRGDIIRMTLGSTWWHYHSNISRTGVIGRPASRMKERWEAIMAAQEAALEAVRPGADISDVHAAAEKELKTAGLRSHSGSYGHGLGVECNERPWIEMGGGELLEGMVINIDVPCLQLGWGGFQLEDTALVTADGFELLTQTERTLYLL